MRKRSRSMKNAGIRRWGSSLGRIRTVAVLVAGLVGCVDGTPTDPEISTNVETFVSLLNSHRESVGCAPLKWDGRVAGVAKAHSQDMIERDFFSHTNPDGDSPWDRLGDAGISYSRAAENIAWGYASAEAVLGGWLGSQGHRANIENCGLTHHGVGLVDWHWTHVFVTP